MDIKVRPSRLELYRYSKLLAQVDIEKPKEQIQKVLSSSLDIDMKKNIIFSLLKRYTDTMASKFIYQYDYDMMCAKKAWCGGATNAYARMSGFKDAIDYLAGDDIFAFCSAMDAFRDYIFGRDTKVTVVEEVYDSLLKDFNMGVPIDESRLWIVYTSLRGVYAMTPSKSLLDEKFIKLNEIYRHITGE